MIIKTKKNITGIEVKTGTGAGAETGAELYANPDAVSEVETVESDVSFEKLKGSVMLLGYFDGFHKGHMALANAALEIKAEKNAPRIVIWTFEHLSKGKKITDNEEKAAAFFSFLNETDGSDANAAIVFEQFETVSHLSGEEFVRDILYRQFEPCAVVCGFNFRFGKNGSSGAKELAEYCKAFDIECRIVPPYKYNRNKNQGFSEELSPVNANSEEENTLVSSTLIRRLISEGDTLTAAELMGRPYAVSGKVIHGKQVGHILGFPTVNLRIPEYKVFPAFGIYACKIKLPCGEIKNGVCNIGSRPTVNGDKSDITLEANIFEFDRDLYGADITVYLYKKLRNEQKFNSLDELSAQIAADKRSAESFFTKNIFLQKNIGLIDYNLI